MKEALESMILLLAPFVPHITEELWQRLGHDTPLSDTAWPEYDREAVVDEEVLVVVQVNGKLRGKVTVPADADQKFVEQMVLSDIRIQGYLEGKALKKLIYVPGKLMNLVVG
jgi:leucyl-tRNA synthetase